MCLFSKLLTFAGTGASGCVIDSQAADRLGMSAFGRLNVTGMEGKNTSRFRKAASLQLGALRVRAPLFMELSNINLVRSAPGPVVGIIGYGHSLFLCSRS